MAIGTLLSTQQNITDFLQFASPAEATEKTEGRWTGLLHLVGRTTTALFHWRQKTEAENSYNLAQNYHTAATKLTVNTVGKIDPIYSNIEKIAFKTLEIHRLRFERARFYYLSGNVGLVGGVFLGVGFYNEIAWLKKASTGVIAFSICYFIGRLVYHWRDHQKIEKLYQEIVPLREQAEPAK